MDIIIAWAKSNLSSSRAKPVLARKLNFNKKIQMRCYLCVINISCRCKYYLDKRICYNITVYISIKKITTYSIMLGFQIQEWELTIKKTWNWKKNGLKCRIQGTTQHNYHGNLQIILIPHNIFLNINYFIK